MDGDDAVGLVTTLGRARVRLVCVDFDQTFCTTKNGGEPLVGTHKLDPGLLALYRWCHPRRAPPAPPTAPATVAPRVTESPVGTVSQCHEQGDSTTAADAYADADADAAASAAAAAAATAAPGRPEAHAPVFHIVTRNSNQQAIEAFLRAHDVFAPVLCVKLLAEAEEREQAKRAAAAASPATAPLPRTTSTSKLSKADVVLSLVRQLVAPGSGGVTLVIDDTIEELTAHETLCTDDGIYRVLFTKGPQI
jgi:hypothetical protein